MKLDLKLNINKSPRDEFTRILNFRHRIDNSNLKSIIINIFKTNQQEMSSKDVYNKFMDVNTIFIYKRYFEWS